MKTNKDAYIALLIVIGIPLATALLLALLSKPMSEPELVDLIRPFLYFAMLIIPGIIIHKHNNESPSHLQKLRESAQALTGTAGLMALINFPEEGVTVIKYIWDESIILLFLIILCAIIVCKLIPFFRKKTVLLAIIKVSSIRISVAFLFTAFVYHINDLTSAQLLAVFLVILGIYTNQIQPGNVKINAIRKQATQLAKQTITLLESLSFSAGLAILMAFAQPPEDMSASKLLTIFFIMFIITWIVALVRNGLALWRH